MFSVRHKASMSSRPRRRCDQLPPCVCEGRSNKPCWIFEKTMLCIVENRGTSPQEAGEKYFWGARLSNLATNSVHVRVFLCMSLRLLPAVHPVQLFSDPLSWPEEHLTHPITCCNPDCTTARASHPGVSRVPLPSPEPFLSFA